MSFFRQEYTSLLQTVCLRVLSIYMSETLFCKNYEFTVLSDLTGQVLAAAEGI